VQIFVINGNARCGKNTFGDIVADILSRRNIPFKHESSIDPVKQYLIDIGWEGMKWDGIVKDDYWRNAMYLCKHMLKEQDFHIYDKYAVEKLLELSYTDSRAVIFFDIREPENIAQLVEYIHQNHPEIGIETVFLDRENPEKYNNYADTNQSGYEEYTIYVGNQGSIYDLHVEADHFVNSHILSNPETSSELSEGCKV
jgi:hypothetical protein